VGAEATEEGFVGAGVGGGFVRAEGGALVCIEIRGGGDRQRIGWHLYFHRRAEVWVACDTEDEEE
jgi:hypothetical protein